MHLRNQHPHPLVYNLASKVNTLGTTVKNRFLNKIPLSYFLVKICAKLKQYEVRSIDWASLTGYMVR